MNKNNKKPIEKWRKEIDQIDNKIVDLLNKRANIQKEIGNFKKEKNLKIYSRKRENELLDKLALQNEGIISNDHLKEIYRVILKISRKMQDL